MGLTQGGGNMKLTMKEWEDVALLLLLTAVFCRNFLLSYRGGIKEKTTSAGALESSGLMIIVVSVVLIAVIMAMATSPLGAIVARTAGSMLHHPASKP